MFTDFPGEWEPFRGPILNSREEEEESASTRARFVVWELIPFVDL